MVWWKKRGWAVAGDVCEQLREAVQASGKTVYRVAKDAGIKPTVLSRFLRRERDIRGETFAKVAAALGLELRPKDSPPPGGGRRRRK
jgi:DNA-binding phage protein